MSTISRSGVGTSRLLERADTLAALHGAYSEARAGGTRLAFVAGEAGTGKTSLVRSFGSELRSARILEGGCDPLFTLGPGAVGGRRTRAACRSPGSRRSPARR